MSQWSEILQRKPFIARYCILSRKGKVGIRGYLYLHIGWERRNILKIMGVLHYYGTFGFINSFIRKYTN